MLTRSTLGLRSELPCRLLRSRDLSTKAHFVALTLPPRSRISSTSRPQQGVLEERNGPRNHDASTTRSLPSRRPVSVNRAPSLRRTSFVLRMPMLPVEKKNDNHPASIESPLDTQDRQRDLHSEPSSIKRKCPAQRRRTLLWVMLTAKTPDRAWAAYEELLSRRVDIPHHLLHQLARLLTSVKPRTRTVHLQLLSVLKTLKRNRGRLHLWEWNTLIDSVGKRWHKTRLEDYENSLDIFNKRGVLPAGSSASADEAVNAETDSCLIQQKPDIWTHNILLSIASRSGSPLAIRHASSLLLASGLTPNRYTHLCLLRDFASRKDLGSIRSTLRKMKQQGLEVGLDGINACLWAFTQSGRPDIALRVYRILRSNIKPTPNLGEHTIDEDSCYIRDTIGLDISDHFEPNEITYTTMIQSLAYHGDLRNALSVFVDMLSTPNRDAATRRDDTVHYKPSMAAFRGLFLGFARHGREVEHQDTECVAALFPSSEVTWDQDALETVFAAFLQLPDFPKPPGRVIYWILVAFDKTSARDSAKLREVWTKLEAKYGGDWGGRLEEIRRTIFTPADQ